MDRISAAATEVATLPCSRLPARSWGRRRFSSASGRREAMASFSSKFPLGQVVATPRALEALQHTGQSPLDFFTRHALGDWGELDDEDRRENERSLVEGFRLLSAYHTNDGTRIWIITEADRSVTTLLLPEEY